MRCPLCSCKLNKTFNKIVDYYKCEECEILTCFSIPDNIVKTQNDANLERNNEEYVRKCIQVSK